MNIIKQWLNDLTQLPGIELKHWQPARHSQSTVICTEADLAERLQMLGTVSGWITETGCVRRLTDQVITLTGHVLAGEFYSNQQQHWQVTQLPRGQWQLTSHHLHIGNVENANCLAERTTHLLNSPREGALYYWKLWKPNTENAPENTSALLYAIEELPL